MVRCDTRGVACPRLRRFDESVEEFEMQSLGDGQHDQLGLPSLDSLSSLERHWQTFNYSNLTSLKKAGVMRNTMDRRRETPIWGSGLATPAVFVAKPLSSIASHGQMMNRRSTLRKYSPTSLLLASSIARETEQTQKMNGGVLSWSRVLGSGTKPTAATVVTVTMGQPATYHNRCQIGTCRRTPAVEVCHACHDAACDQCYLVYDGIPCCGQCDGNR